MGNFSNGLQIEALLSVSPSKLSEPQQVRRASPTTELDPFRSDNLGGCLNVLLYYKKACQEDSGWLQAGWVRESLGRALLEQPLFGGRLITRQTHRQDHVADNKRHEIVSNDSGVRLVEARMPLTLSEFLDSKLGKKQKLNSFIGRMLI
ncbi:Chloramphenicol acetyltransferase-like domain containing protein [Trema orientale]|uniref:Chloramphenicol acetyltransferase-like domain containing protein n=1 Tax=Trema orientale TaxID=63057 RepID=A0A2P5FJA5_TREOI|nr:Chloramphenicol acetyltransferase-like domain containing protein [Trema orientale]